MHVTPVQVCVAATALDTATVPPVTFETAVPKLRSVFLVTVIAEIILAVAFAVAEFVAACADDAAKLTAKMAEPTSADLIMLNFIWCSL